MLNIRYSNSIQKVNSLSIIKDFKSSYQQNFLRKSISFYKPNTTSHLFTSSRNIANFSFLSSKNFSKTKNDPIFSNSKKFHSKSTKNYLSNNPFTSQKIIINNQKIINNNSNFYQNQNRKKSIFENQKPFKFSSIVNFATLPTSESLHDKFGFDDDFASKLRPKKMESPPEFKSKVKQQIPETKFQQEEQNENLNLHKRVPKPLKNENLNFEGDSFRIDFEQVAATSLEEESQIDYYDDIEFSTSYFEEQVHMAKNHEKELMYQILGHIQANRLPRAVQDVRESEFSNILHWTAILEAYRKEKNPKEALKIFDEEIVQKELKRNVVTYGTVLHLYIEDNLKTSSIKVRKLWDEMLKEGVKPNTAAYSAAIFSHAQTGNLLEALSVFKHMKESNADIDPRTYMTIFSKLSQLIKADELEKLWYRLLKEPYDLGSLGLSSLIFAFAKTRHHRKAFEVKNHMKDKGLPIALVGFKGLLVAQSKAPVWNHQTFWRITEEMERTRSELEEKNPEEAKKLFPLPVEVTNLIVHNIILTGARNRASPVEAQQIYQNMKRKKIKPDIVTYTILTDSFGSAKGDLNQLENILEEFERSNVQKNAHFYYTLLDSYAKRGYVSKLLEVINQIKQEPEHIRTQIRHGEILQYLLKCYVRRNDKENALKVYYSMRELRVSNPIALNHIISLFGNLLDLEALTNFWKEEAIHYAPLRLPTLYLLFDALSRCGAFGVWPLYLQDIKENHLPILSARLYLSYLKKVPAKDEDINERIRKLTKSTYQRDTKLTSEEEEEFLGLATKLSTTYSDYADTTN